MTTIDVLICSIDKGIVRILDVLEAPLDNVRYIVSYQYTDERYLDLIPAKLTSRPDVELYKYKGSGLSSNRNLALEKATADLVIYSEDDSHIEPSSFDVIIKTFESHPEVDVAFFQATTYLGKPLKNYPAEEFELTEVPEDYSVSVIEMVARREKVQGILRFDERFGLGTKFLTCGEEEIWMLDALKMGLKMRYFPIKIIETSTMLKKSLFYVDEGVQRSRGAITYYKYGSRAWWICLGEAIKGAMSGMCHFFPMMRNLSEGIRYMKKYK